ncbi:hypothetical protein B9Z55_029030 [Caenorhabditis nigoni]|uniref:Uncharacterized protein n=1 Tax=Caenorhabditis nigoni TaxID=1611254 RepID=A0A2G5S9D0_9PELO|nr:hypothetical protein B9Z55_029030 [Caenorhabditis nigoni]
MEVQKTQSLPQQNPIIPKRGYDKVDGLLDEDWETDEEKEKKKQRKLKKLEDAKFHMVDELEKLEKSRMKTTEEAEKTAKEEEVDDVNCKEVIDPIIEEMNRRQEERKRKKSKSRSTEEPLEAPPTTVTLATKSAHKSVNFKEDTYHVFVENFHKKSVSTNSGPISDQNFFQIPTKKPMQPPAKEKKKKNTGCCGIL